MDEISKSENEIAMLNRDIAAQRETFRAEASGELSEARAIIATRGALVEKANRREALQLLTSPIDAIVNEIAVTTIGEVAEPGQSLITLVPTGDELIIEAFLLNRDVCFVKEMQPVIIKLEAFPFMRYGFLEGEVEHVSPDAIIDEARGLVYPARIRITGSTLRSERLGIGANSAQTPNSLSSTNDRAGAGFGGADSVGNSEHPASDQAGAARLDRELVSGEEQARANDLKTALALTQPGMAVTAEVKTGTRSVISYLLSPIAKATSEAGRER